MFEVWRHGVGPLLYVTANNTTELRLATKCVLFLQLGLQRDAVCGPRTSEAARGTRPQPSYLTEGQAVLCAANPAGTSHVPDCEHHREGFCAPAVPGTPPVGSIGSASSVLVRFYL